MCPKQSFARIKAYFEVPMKLCQRIFLQLCKLFYSKRLFLGKGQTLRKDDSCDSTFWPSAMGYLFLCSCSVITSAVATSCPPLLIPTSHSYQQYIRKRLYYTVAQIAITGPQPKAMCKQLFTTMWAAAGLLPKSCLSVHRKYYVLYTLYHFNEVKLGGWIWWMDSVLYLLNIRDCFVYSWKPYR